MPDHRHLTRRECLRLFGGAGVGAILLNDASPVAARTPFYRDQLHKALQAMEEGMHAQALAPLKAALAADRNDPAALLVLGTLYLHTGSAPRAAREFVRARLMDADNEIAAWGLALTAMATGAAGQSGPLLNAVSEARFPEAPLLNDYVRLLTAPAVSAKDLAAATAEVTPEETNLLRLQVAGFAALQGGDPARGESLMKALLNRPEMRTLAEDRAALLSFLPDALVQGGASPLPYAIALPEPEEGPPQTGRVTLLPPRPLPDETAVVTYWVEGGGGLTASVNYPPFVSEWNTTRFPNGVYTVRAAAFDANGTKIAGRARTVVVSNPEAPLSNLLSPEERHAIQERIRKLLTPRPTRKAAHFALAERAAKRGDTASALRHIESVVAIDPLYRNARASLKKFNLTVVGRREGIWRGVTQQKLVALTYDDGPNPAPHRTPALLDALKEAGVKATFFVVGVRAEQNPDLLRRMDAEGHEIANHSYSHPNLTLLSQPAIERELCRTSCIVRDAIGKRPHFYRPPGGNFNRTVIDAAEMLGMAGAYWTVDVHKYEGQTHKPEYLAKIVLDQVRPGAIVLMHNAPENTIAAVPLIVRGLRARGYTPVTMTELVQRCRAAGPDAKFKPYSAGETK
jgi:peptidoglycan-N-acetylglucosamine deacetylase